MINNDNHINNYKNKNNSNNSNNVAINNISSENRMNSNTEKNYCNNQIAIIKDAGTYKIRRTATYEKVYDRAKNPSKTPQITLKLASLKTTVT